MRTSLDNLLHFGQEISLLKTPSMDGLKSYAHQHGFLHRDIKPSNVLLDEQGGVYLVDFGIAHLFDSGLYTIDQALTSITTTGKIYGTPTYMAPERFKGEQAGPATDIYALGILLYQLVTGQVPFKADSPIAIGMKHLNEMPPFPVLTLADLFTSFLLRNEASQ